MNLRDQIERAIRDELARQAESNPQMLSVRTETGVAQLSGAVDLTLLAATIVGTIGGEP